MTSIKFIEANILNYMLLSVTWICCF